MFSRITETWFDNPLLRKATLLHVPILFSLFILTDNDTQQTSTRHLAVFTALSRHAPSMRVFRGLFVINVLGFCSSLTLYVLEATVGKTLTERLFFLPPYTLIGEQDPDDDEQEGYELTGIEDAYDAGEEDNDHGDEDDDEQIDSRQEPNVVVTRTARSPAGTICNMSLDLLLFILIALFLFTISSSAGGRYIDQTTLNTDSSGIFAKLGDIAAPTFPLILFFVCAAKTVFPWTKQKHYCWTVVAYTLGAPMYDIEFRDGFIGDIFTSMVRPMQDIAFTSFYLMSGLQGWWIYREQASEEDINLPVERSWLLHTIILPACTVSPLWWRFCQCLRQCYDTKKRWPYLGNAAKYFFAAQVAMFGVFDPGQTGSAIWIMAFVCATLYQLWWDVFLDWELLEWVPGSGAIGGSYQLRSQRLYKRKSLYIFIFVVNFFLRFCWTLNVMPSRYLSPSGALLNTFSADFPTLIAPTLACAEIIRRSLWGLLRVELEVINLSNKENVAMFDRSGKRRSDKELEPMIIESATGGDLGEMMPVGSNLNSSTNVLFQNDLSAANDVQVLWEMGIYATVFTCMGIVAAVHRQVM